MKKLILQAEQLRQECNMAISNIRARLSHVPWEQGLRMDSELTECHLHRCANMLRNISDDCANNRVSEVSAQGDIAGVEKHMTVIAKYL